MNHKIAGILLFAIFSLAASGWASQIVPSSGSRPPTDAGQVMIYEKPPKKYEVLGTVEVPVGGEVRWDHRGDASLGFERLKAQAAARGANGLLLGDVPHDLEVGAGYKGTFYRVPVRYGSGTPDVAVAQAIYALEK